MTNYSLRVLRGGGVLAAVLSLVMPSLAGAQLRAELVAEGFARPVGIVADPLGGATNTLMILEQAGLIRAVVDGVIQPTPVLDLTSEVKMLDEQGLLGMAFSRDGQRAFVSWVKRRNPDGEVGDTVVSRFARSADPLVLDPASRFDLVWPDGLPHITQPLAVHKGGNLQLGPDDYLYIGLGDGGAGGHLEANAQSPAHLAGKFLRLNVNVPDNHPRGYEIPPDNPFAGNDPLNALDEIWSFGLRNPWRWSFDDVGPGATGALIMGDVGQDHREEINYEPYRRGGRNYGWYMREGTIATPGVNPNRQPAYLPLTEPMVDYPHEIGRSVTGGYVYRGSALHPTYQGRYFVADFFGGVYSLGLAIGGNGEARVADVMDHSVELGSLRFIPTFGRGMDGELYFSVVSGRVYRIAPGIVTPPAPPVNFTSTVTGGTVSLSWQGAPGGGPALGYRLEAGSATGLADLLVTDTGTTGMVVPGVPPGLYFVRVRGFNSAGLGEASAERAIRVGCGGPPPVPAGLTGSVASGGIVSLSWSALDEAASYLIEAGSASGLNNLASIPVGAATAVSGEVPAGTYYVRVRAVTACGTTAASNEIVLTVP